jgi:hypothetical protein
LNLAIALGASSSIRAPADAAELARAFCDAHASAPSELRLRKWIAAFGDLSAWAVNSEQLESAAHAMRKHGYAGATANRDLSTLGSMYRWPKQRRLSPRALHESDLGLERFEGKLNSPCSLRCGRRGEDPGGFLGRCGPPVRRLRFDVD